MDVRPIDRDELQRWLRLSQNLSQMEDDLSSFNSAMETDDPRCFLAAVDAQLYTLAIIGVLTSVIGAFYYLRVIKVCYFDDPADSFDTPIPRTLVVIIAATAFLMVAFILYPAPLLDSAAYAARSLVGG